MSSELTSIPQPWRLFWLFFMQPITLHRLLRSLNIDPNGSGWALWRLGGVSRDYVKRSAFVLVTAPVAITSIALFFSNLLREGTFLDPTEAASAVAVGVAWGVALAVTRSVAWGVAWGVALVVAGDVALAVAEGVDLAVAGGVALAVARGVAETVVLAVAGGVAGGFAGGFALGFAGGFAGGFVWGVPGGVTQGMGIAGGFTWGIAGGFVWGVAGGVTALLFHLRLPFYSIEAPLQSVLYLGERLSSRPNLQFSPVLHHNLSYIPHPFLERHLLLSAERDPSLVRQALDACSITPGQRRIGRAVLGQLQAREMELEIRKGHFGPLTELRGTWLPGTAGASSLLLGFVEVARYLASAEGTSIPYHRLQKLKRAEAELGTLRNRLLQEKSSEGIALRSGPLPAWQDIVTDRLRAAEVEASRQLPNPFRAKEPLNPEQGREVFRGREDLIRKVENLVGEPGRGCSIALLGPRRTGKTSLLKMLPQLLPDAVCVFFDLQDNPIDSPSSFFSALARRAQEQALRDRQLKLPELPEGSPFEAGSRWIEALDTLPGDLRVLLCIDEFERLETLFPGSRRELLQLLGLIRATIQHRQRVRVLVAGAAPFEELDALWNDHLINAREIRIGFLEKEAAYGLLRKPIPEFPEDAVPEPVAAVIFERTGGQPNLLQLYGSLLVTRLNDQDRIRAEVADVDHVEEEVLTQETYYFRNILQEAPLAAQAALLSLAHEQAPELDASTRRWLRRRLLITEDRRLTMPVFGAWIRAEEGA